MKDQTRDAVNAPIRGHKKTVVPGGGGTTVLIVTI